MPTKVEKDAATGKETTGHEWDGIKELNTPLPKWWLYVFYATIAFSLVYYVLYPAIPGFNSYTRGVLGYTQGGELAERMAEAQAARAPFLDRINAMTPGEIAEDPELFNFALAGGQVTFAENCAPCHGPGGAGNPGFPSLADDSWLWGGTIEDIHTTLLYGIRSGHEQARDSQMPAFGAFQMLTPEQMSEVADHVLSLSGQPHDPAAATHGQEIYEANCASCHGPSGEGARDFGAPALNDQIWLYANTKESIVAQVNSPRHGVMPAWVGRLDPATIKMLTLYVHSLGGGEPTPQDLAAGQ